MIKKITGILFAAAVIAVIVMTAMHRSEYRSLVFDRSDKQQTQATIDTTTLDAEQEAAQESDRQQLPDDNAQQEPDEDTAAA
ncbi:MAG: hypothetical protein K2F95_00580 [Alistipes sp.]|nr:hypothetical protein [Alistipes sp.]MDE7129308.1 hypothetical protein [Alistipes sp.]